MFLSVCCAMQVSVAFFNTDSNCKYKQLTFFDWWESCIRSQVQLRVCFLQNIYCCFIKLVLNSRKDRVCVSSLGSLDQTWSGGHFLSHNHPKFSSLGMVCAILENELRITISLQKAQVKFQNILFSKQFINSRVLLCQGPLDTP